MRMESCPRHGSSKQALGGVGLVMVGVFAFSACKSSGAPPSASCRAVLADLEARRIRTFDEWRATSALEPSQLTALGDRTDQADMVGPVPEEELPVRHPHGSVEMSPAMFERYAAGSLHYDLDFEQWLAAGLYDPSNVAERKAAAKYVAEREGQTCVDAATRKVTASDLRDGLDV